MLSKAYFPATTLDPLTSISLEKLILVTLLAPVRHTIRQATWAPNILRPFNEGRLYSIFTSPKPMPCETAEDGLAAGNCSWAELKLGERIINRKRATEIGFI